MMYANCEHTKQYSVKHHTAMLQEFSDMRVASEEKPEKQEMKSQSEVSHSQLAFQWGYNVSPKKYLGFLHF